MSIIYKYREWKKPFKSILEDNLLWFPSVKTLRKKDPNELKNYVDFSKVPINSRLNYFISITRNNFSNLDWIEIIKIANTKCEEDRKNNWKLFEGMGEGYAKHIGKKVGICSFSEKSDLVSQWVNYADNFQGICIGFDLKALMESVGGHGGPIKYENEYDHPAPTFNIMEDIFVVHYKT